MTAATEIPQPALDHVGLIVPDLEAARALWSALGFTLTARAEHTRSGPDGRKVPAGSAQHSVMLQEGYIELMQITDVTAGHPLTPAMQQRFGLHILALATDDPHATHQALADRGCALSPVMDWSRAITEGPVQGLARFLFFDTPWQPTDASYLCWVRHMTPELVRPPAMLRHANGAQALRGLTYTGSAASCQHWRERLQGLGVQPEDVQLHIQPDGSTDRVRPTALHLALADQASLNDLAARARACGLAPVRLGAGLSVELGPRCPIRLEARATGSHGDDPATTRL